MEWHLLSLVCLENLFKENFRKHLNYLIFDMCSMTTMKMLNLIKSEYLYWKRKIISWPWKIHNTIYNTHLTCKIEFSPYSWKEWSVYLQVLNKTWLSLPLQIKAQPICTRYVNLSNTSVMSSTICIGPQKNHNGWKVSKVTNLSYRHGIQQGEAYWSWTFVSLSTELRLLRKTVSLRSN